MVHFCVFFGRFWHVFRTKSGVGVGGRSNRAMRAVARERASEGMDRQAGVSARHKPVRPLLETDECAVARICGLAHVAEWGVRFAAWTHNQSTDGKV
jgi:hypothetical protein